MTQKILAKFPAPTGLTDLFPGQGFSIDNGKITPTDLVGPDFNLAFPVLDIVVAQGKALLNAQLTLPPVAALGGLRPVLDVELPLLSKPDATFLMQDLDKLKAVIPEMKILNAIVIRKGAATLRLGLEPWQLALEGTANSPVASIDLPGMAGIKFEVSRLVIDASGVTDCQAALVPSQTKIGDLVLQINEGTLVLRGSQIEARLQARFELTYFRGASVDVQLVVRGDLAKAASEWSISGLTRVANNVPWRDPSGMLSFDQMVVTVDFTRVGENLTSAIRIGGRVTFLPQNLAADADAWFGRLFSGLAVSFENADLNPGDIGLPAFSFSPPEGLHLRAFEIFDMRVPKLAFEKSSVRLLDAVLRFEAGGAVVSGTVGAIKIRLEGEPAIDISGGSPSIAIELAAPGGFKGQASLTQIDEANVQAVRGKGRISSPALGAVEASFQIGRFFSSEDKSWHPAVSMMAAQEDVNVALFPGVVATRVEMGAGINRKVAGVTGLSLAEGQRRLQEGLPDVFQQESWEDTLTDLCVVARIFAESSQTRGDQALSLYVADMTLLMTSDLQFAAFGKLWFYTKRADAKSADFQKFPSAVGLAMFDGQQPSLRVVAMTRPDGRSSLTDHIPAGQLLGMQIPRSQLAFEAMPSGMTLALGPVDVGTTLGPLRVAGSTSFVLRSAGGRVYAISRSSLSAAFNASTGRVSIGPATLSGSVSASFSATLALLGNFSDGCLTVYGLAHASCSVELALYVQIGFRIRISVGFGSITISWHENWDFKMSMHVDLDLEAALTSDAGIGIEGRARISVNVLGISASLSLHIAAESKLIEKGRVVYKTVVEDVNKLLGAPA
ncbi:hypothetical protein BK661_10120 [Pseudomonas frederiksbergensis]|uniref:Uncharacterized protein n=1 Tax=Pseudomonas frederiksbergensis TaxID=104087 RepID=A0A423J9S0_9PSED|nr:hypothetical protein [Pseudomonas frederiksbergensis]RON34426.1 hypothetical protein BK661_10120 [Pseudomonas frederiksbergensis]